MKKNNLVVLSVFFLALSSFSYSSNPTSYLLNHNCLWGNYILNVQLYDDVLVGQRTGENTAQLSISKSGIQQNILVSFPELNGALVTDGPISIQINKITSYLIFSINNAGGKKITVALELISNSNDLMFRAKSGREMHICKSNGSCNSCQFIFDDTRIIACTCNSGSDTDSSANTNCQHRGMISR